MTQQQVTIKIGEQGDAFAKRYATLIKIDRQPAGLDFYKIQWDKRARGNVTIEHDKHSFEIDDVLSATGIFLPEKAHEGLLQFDINAGITEPDLIDHDEARLKTYAILQRLLDAGWKPIHALSMPRLKGKNRFNFVVNVNDSIGLDPFYVPTLEEWMKIGNLTDWRFYADHLYLTLNFTRDEKLTDPNKPGAYLLSFNIKSDIENARVQVGPYKRDQWRALLPNVYSEMRTLRDKTEAQLRAKGITIDETYQDPPMPDVK